MIDSGWKWEKIEKNSWWTLWDGLILGGFGRKVEGLCGDGVRG